MGKLTINMASFNKYVKLPEGRSSPFFSEYEWHSLKIPQEQLVAMLSIPAKTHQIWMHVWEQVSNLPGRLEMKLNWRQITDWTRVRKTAAVVGLVDGPRHDQTIVFWGVYWGHLEGTDSYTTRHGKSTEIRRFPSKTNFVTWFTG